MIPFSMYFKMLTNAFEALTWGTKILSKYNQAYTESYFDAIRECQKQAAEYKNFEVFDNLRCMLPSEELYEEWLKNTDTKLNDLLKSEEFSSLLSNYVESNLEFRKLLKAQGYPIQYFEDIYEFITNNWNSYYTRRKDKVVSEFRISYKK